MFYFWQKNVTHLTGKNFKDTAAIASTTYFCKGKRDAIIICQKDILWSNASFELHPVHCISRNCTATVKNKLNLGYRLFRLKKNASGTHTEGTIYHLFLTAFVACMFVTPFAERNVLFMCDRVFFI